MLERHPLVRSAVAFGVAAHFGRDIDRALVRIEGIIEDACEAGVSLLVLPDATLGGCLADLQHPDPAATPPAVSLDGPQLRRVAELAGDMVVCSDSRRSWPGIPASSGTTQRSRSAGTVCSGPTARCTSRSESRWSNGRVTVSRPSTPRSVGWGCSSTTTRPSRRRLGRSPSTASVTDRAERSQQDRQSRLFDLYDCTCAAENQVIVVSSNQTGVTGGLRFLGQAKVVGPGGDVLARTGSRGALAAAAIDVRYEITRARRMLHHLDERVLDSSHSALTRPGR